MYVSALYISEWALHGSCVATNAKIFTKHKHKLAYII